MMGWFGFVRSPRRTSSVAMRIPLFPLNTVLFPGGVLPLRKSSSNATSTWPPPA
jgi:hypothetical protein